MVDAFVGEIRIFGGDYAPAGWLVCDGQVVANKDYPKLGGVLGRAFGGDGDKTFGVPDLRGRVVVGDGTATSGTTYSLRATGGSEAVALTAEQMPRHTHIPGGSAQAGGSASPTAGVWALTTPVANAFDKEGAAELHPDSIGFTGGGGAHDNVMPYLPLNFIVATDGDDPTATGRRPQGQPMLAEIRLFPIDRIPEGWVQCDGAEIRIADNQAAYSVIGSSFGGDDRKVFRAPDLRGRVPIHGSGGEVGRSGGAETVSLGESDLPAHTHGAVARTGGINRNFATERRSWGGGFARFAPATGSMSRKALTTAGGSGEHPNMQPYIVLVYALCLRGIFPAKG